MREQSIFGLDEANEVRDLGTVCRYSCFERL